MSEPLVPGRLTEIIDIGANPIDGDPPYKAMLKAGLCRVTGFEPQERALAELEARRGPNERYLPYVIADGNLHALHICRHSGLTSLLEPNGLVTGLYRDLGPNSEVIERRGGVQTRRLDDLTEVERIDLLKIDVQGSELVIFSERSKTPIAGRRDPNRGFVLADLSWPAFARRNRRRAESTSPSYSSALWGKLASVA